MYGTNETTEGESDSQCSISVIKSLNQSIYVIQYIRMHGKPSYWGEDKQLHINVSKDTIFSTTVAEILLILRLSLRNNY